MSTSLRNQTYIPVVYVPHPLTLCVYAIMCGCFKNEDDNSKVKD